jgi:pyocin large subunit-like protein
MPCLEIALIPLATASDGREQAPIFRETFLMRLMTSNDVTCSYETSAKAADGDIFRWDANVADLMRRNSMTGAELIRVSSCTPSMYGPS